MSGDESKDLLSEIDVRLNGVLGELGRALGEAITKLEDGGGEVRRSQSFETAKGRVRAEAGIRVRMGEMEIGSQGRESEFADPAPINTPHQTAQNAPDDIRDIAATIVSNEHHWSLTAELPGAAEQSLDVKVEAGQVRITAKGAGRMYQGAFACPAYVQRAALSVSLRNGILDITAVQPGGAP
ncbi:MAG: hypothetical protein AAFW64_00030 [Pseudomonadota bacterium]